MANAQHSSASVTWYTPAPIIERARRVLGTIMLDPASDAVANEVVCAELYLSEGGLTWAKWPRSATVWLNPPGGKFAGDSLAGEFWRALMRYREAGYLLHALFLAFSLEALQNTQEDDELSCMAFPFCVPKKRIPFIYPGESKRSPTHANAIVYVPGLLNETARFLETFRDVGACKP